MFESILKALLHDMKERGKDTKIMAVADRSGLPIAISVSSASPLEINLVEPILENMFKAESPKRLIGDKAYNSDPWNMSDQHKQAR